MTLVVTVTKPIIHSPSQRNPLDTGSATMVTPMTLMTMNCRGILKWDLVTTHVSQQVLE